MSKSINPLLIDVPSSAPDCRPLFRRWINKAPEHILAELEGRGAHNGNGTSWAGGYETYEIYDNRRPDWPTEDAEKWHQEIEWQIASYLQQQKEMKVR